MQINITGRHVDITPALKDYVTQKFDKIERHFSHITNVHVILSVDKKFQQKAEATLSVSKGEIFADNEHTDMYAAIDGLINKLDRQVIKHKEKLQDRSTDDDIPLS